MKKSISILMILLWVNWLNAQGQKDTLPIPQSKFEKFTSESGVMYRKEFMTLGKTKFAEVSYRKATNLDNNTSSESISIDGQGGTGLFSSGGQLYIDIDELPSVIKALEFYLKFVDQGKWQNEEEYVFYTTNRIRIGLYHIEKGFAKGTFIQIVQLYKYINYERDGMAIRLSDKETREILILLKKGLSVNMPRT